MENIDIGMLVSTYVIPWGVNIAIALAVFLIGRLFIKLLVPLLEKVLVKAEMAPILVNFVTSIVRTLLLLFVIVAALDQLGVDTTSLIALVGAAGLAVGLALQGSLQNFAAGVLMVIFRPFKAGDFVEVAGTSGAVEAINIFSTTLRTGDNREVIVPNGAIYNGTITNYSARETRRIDMVFGIGYDDDLRQAKALLLEILEADERVLKDPAPAVALAELGDSSVNFNVRPWVKSGDYWAVRSAITEQVKLRFDAEGISIPYPQMDLHLQKSEPGVAA